MTGQEWVDATEFEANGIEGCGHWYTLQFLMWWDRLYRAQYGWEQAWVPPEVLDAEEKAWCIPVIYPGEYNGAQEALDFADAYIRSWRNTK